VAWGSTVAADSVARSGRLLVVHAMQSEVAGRGSHTNTAWMKRSNGDTEYDNSRHPAALMSSSACVRDRNKVTSGGWSSTVGRPLRFNAR
jgi:hypothetical protein